MPLVLQSKNRGKTLYSGEGKTCSLLLRKVKQGCSGPPLPTYIVPHGVFPSPAPRARFSSCDRSSNRSRATTPLSHTSEPDLGDPPSLGSLHDTAHNNLSHYRGQYAPSSNGPGGGTGGGGGVGGGGGGGGGGSDATSAAVMNQLGSGHGNYYHEIPAGGLHYANHLDEYDSPVMKGGRKFPQGRRMQAGGSSLSSSDNNSDTTYAESDINSSLRAKMAALDNGK
ncbi:hypothetical protein E2C01_057093 [Portunus trituberculatus]|uniref:Uncharacterized protein n=1 Tax=Portunus trituberculatus TaxID=210409 RepID=A0A5B7GS35_PORTR|nr:hypothetical protein [Portunus trituberculatus]